MDTLYLVFKHQFQIVFGLLTDGINSPQANGDFKLLNLLCQASHYVRRMLFFANKKRRHPPGIPREKRHLYVPLDFDNVNSLSKGKGIIGTIMSLSSPFQNSTHHLLLDRVRPRIFGQV